MFTRWSPDIAMMGGVVTLMASGVLTPEEAIAGLSNEGVVTVGALFVVAAAIERTGALGALVDRVLGRSPSLASAQLRVMVGPGVLSAFMNNTPVVAMMVPMIRSWAKKQRLSVSRLLLPMNNAVVLGGLCTLIGTSTNVVVSGLVQKRTGSPLGMFDITWLGVPIAALGLAYMLIASRRLLPDRRPAVSELDDPREYTTEMLVESGSPLVGKTIEQAGLRHLPSMYLVEIDRAGQVLPAVSSTERLCAEDRLVFAGVVDSVVDLQRVRGLRPAGDHHFTLDAPRDQRTLIEAVVSNTSPLVGQSIRDAKFRGTYHAAVIAVGRNGERLRMKIGDVVLRAGDTLLLEAGQGFAQQQRNSRDFYLVSEVAGAQAPRHDKAWLAGLVLGAMVLVAAFELVPMVVAALVAAGLVVLTGCISANEGRRAIEWDVLLLVAASFGLARAMDKTGVAALVGQTVIGLGQGNPMLALALVYLVTMLFTELMSNNAAAVLVFPIAWSTAEALQVSPMPFVMAITVAASCGFATPMGYQTNMMVYGPGGYRFIDYVRFGGLLNLIAFAVTMLVAPRVWTWHP